MIIAIRGEGKSDVGYRDYSSNAFVFGPVISLIEKLECFQRLNELCLSVYWELVDRNEIKEKRQKKKRMILKGRKGNDELKYFFDEAKTFAEIAQEKYDAELVIFFVDLDKGNYETYYDSIKEGLKDKGFDKNGVPMIPVKVFESWLLCCCQHNKRCANALKRKVEYNECSKFEELPVGHSSSRHPKTLLGNVIDELRIDRESFIEQCDPNEINMPSFEKFKEDFYTAINFICKYNFCN